MCWISVSDTGLCWFEVKTEEIPATTGCGVRLVVTKGLVCAVFRLCYPNTRVESPTSKSHHNLRSNATSRPKVCKNMLTPRSTPRAQDTDDDVDDTMFGVY